MAAVAEIRFSADVRNAQKNIQALNREVAQLGERLNTSQRRVAPNQRRFLKRNLNRDSPSVNTGKANLSKF